MLTARGSATGRSLSMLKLCNGISTANRTGVLVAIARERATRKPCATWLTAACISSVWLRIGPRVTTRPSASPSTATTMIISSSVNPACRRPLVNGR